MNNFVPKQIRIPNPDFYTLQTPTARQNAILYFMKLPVLDTQFK